MSSSLTSGKSGFGEFLGDLVPWLPSGNTPWLVEFQKEYEARGLVVIGISMDDDGWKSVRPWLKEKKVNYPIVIGNEGLGKQYGLDGMPLTALVDREGRIADVHPGLLDKAATQQKIRALLQESSKDSTN